LEGWTERRRKNAQTYDRLFRKKGVTDQLTLPSEVVPRHVYNQYVIRVKENRNKLRHFLTKKNMATEIYYPLPLHLQDCFSYLEYKKGDFPEGRFFSFRNKFVSVNLNILIRISHCSCRRRRSSSSSWS